MAQPDCPNTDMSNDAIVHSPIFICSDLDNQRGREDEEGEEEDEEVELAEEVGEDVLIMTGAGEGQDEENREQNERKEVKIIQVDPLPNGVISKENGEGESLEENCMGELEMSNKGDMMIDEDTEEEGKKQDESNDRHMVIENQCDLLTMIDLEKRQELLDNNTGNKQDMDNEENKQDVTVSLETELKEETNNRDNNFEEHECVSSTDYAEQNPGTLVQGSGEGMQLSANEIDKPEDVCTDGEETERSEPSITDITPVTTEINQQFHSQDHTSQTSMVSDSSISFDTISTVEVMINQINKLTNENEYLMKNTDENDNSESNKQEDANVTEENVENERDEEFLKDAMSVLDDAPEIGSEANQQAEQPDLDAVSSEEQSETGGVEEARVEGTNQKLEEECVLQVRDNTLMEINGVGKSMEEEVKISDNVVSESLYEEEHGESGDIQVQEEKIVKDEKQVHIELLKPELQCVDEVPLETEQDVDLEKIREDFELEESCECEPGKTGVEDTSKEKESKTEEEDDLQEPPLQILKDRVISEHALSEDSKQDATDDEALAEEMEMVDEPVTVLDDDIEELEETSFTELDDKMPASIKPPSSTVETKDQEHQDLQRKDTEQKDGKQEVKNYEKPKDDKREVEFDSNDRIKGLTQAVEAECMLCAESEPTKKEDLGTARVLSHRRKDDDWIKKDRPEEKQTQEVKDWKKELKPLKKEICESEGRQKDTLPEKKSLLKKEDWITELKSAIKDESLPRKRDEQVKKKRVVLLEDGYSYFPQQEEMNEKRKEVKLISHKKVESPLSPVQDNRIGQDQDYEISLYVKVKKYRTLKKQLLIVNAI